MIGKKVILDSNFKEYVTELLHQSRDESSALFLPVGLTDEAHNTNVELGKLNFVRASHNDYSGHTDRFHYIYHSILYKLCELFINSDNNVENHNLVKLFVSHSKHDSTVEKAKAFRDYINSNTQLKTFFDANDIGHGNDFAKVIERNAGNCIVVAFWGDTYSSRAWCRTEIIIAKSNHCPLVIVNAVESGENRSFPYLGNTPTRRWDGDDQAIADLALEATLRSYYVKLSLEQQANLYQVQYDLVFSGYPELFSIIGIKEKLSEEGKETGIIIYPDPPLGNEELGLLNKMDERLTFITPLQLSSLLHHE